MLQCSKINTPFLDSVTKDCAMTNIISTPTLTPALTHMQEVAHLTQNGLYAGKQEHDACGVGFVAHIKGKKSHDIVKNALKILENLDHRGAVGADKLMGDGAGISDSITRCTLS
jgi:hypothetical protein